MGSAGRQDQHPPAGRAAAFASWSHEFEPRLRRRFARDVRRAGLDIDDFVQEVLIRVFAHWGGLRGEPSHYALVVGRNLLTELVTAASSRREVCYADLTDVDRPVGTHDPGVVAVVRDAASLAVRAAQRLPFRQRYALAADVEGLSRRDIAAHLDLAGTAAVDSLIQRARTTLRKELAPLLRLVVMIAGVRRLRRHLARHGTATAAVPMLVVTVVTLSVALPPGRFPLSPRPAQATPARAGEYGQQPDVLTAVATTVDTTVTGAGAPPVVLPSDLPPAPPERPDRRVRVCVPNTAGHPPRGQSTCASTGGDEPGDEVCVHGPGPADHQCVRQSVVPVCDVVPDNDIVDCHRYGDPSYWPVPSDPPSDRPGLPGIT